MMSYPNYTLLRNRFITLYGSTIDLRSKFYPYEDDYMSMREQPESENIMEVDEIALDKFINRIIFNQSVTLSEGPEYHESVEASPLKYDTVKIPEKYIGDVRKIPEEQKPRSRLSSLKSSKRGKSRKPRDKLMEEDEIQFKDLHDDVDITHKDGKTMVTMSIDMLRGYMFTEVEARVRYIHNYYERQWTEVNREKMALYTKMIEQRYEADNMEVELQRLYYQNQVRQKVLENVNSKIDVSKEAKRRRRQAKKQRKQTAASEGASESDTFHHHGVNEMSTTQMVDESTETSTTSTSQDKSTETGSSQSVDQSTSMEASQLFDKSTDTNTREVNEETMPGGGDNESIQCEEHKKPCVADIDAEINALVL